MPNNILIIGPAWVGDMVMAQTLFILLREHNPDINIDVLAPDWNKPLLERMGQVNNALSLPFKHGELNCRGRYKIAKLLRHKNYDQAIVLPNSWKSALIPFWAKISLRTGWRGEMRYGLLNDCRILDKTKLPLMIQRFCALALPGRQKLPDYLPRPSLVSQEEKISVAIDKHHIKTDKPIMALCPGAEFGPAKRWPARHYAKVAKSKLERGYQVWLFGSSNDQATAAEIQKEVNNTCVDLTGKTSLAEAIDLLSLADCVVSNDSGLMHIAAALARPLVVLYGSSSPGFTPPLSDNVEILSENLACSPCFQRECPLKHLNCLRNLQSERVLDALMRLKPNESPDC